MRIRMLHLFSRAALFALLWASLSGCFLRLAVGNVNYVETGLDEINDWVQKVSSSATGGTCYSFAAPPHNRNVQCSYVVDGEPLSSTVSLVSEFGIFGVFVDPLILEVPDDVISVTANYDNAAGPQPLPGFPPGP